MRMPRRICIGGDSRWSPRVALAVTAFAALVVLVGCGGHRPPHNREARVDTAEITARYRRVHAAADRRIGLSETVADERTGPPRRAAARCLDDWRASPESVRDPELLVLWETAVTRPAFAVQRPAFAAEVRRLERIRGVRDVPGLDRHLRTLEADLRYLTRIYARPIAACSIVREWRGRGWQAPTPAVIRDLLRAGSAWASEARRIGHRRYRLPGFGMPDHGGYCDPVFLVLDPEDGFCG
jgi:hypothetical protein